MEIVKRYSKVAAIISLLLIPLAILFDCGGRGTKWPLLTLLAPIVLEILFLCLFCLLNKADQSFRTPSVLGIVTFSTRLLSQFLLVFAFILHNYLHRSNVGVTMASGTLMWVYYIVLLVSFLLLQSRFKKQAFLRTVTILLPLVLIGLFAISFVNSAKSTTPLYEYLRSTIPFAMAAVFFYAFSVSNNNTIVS